MNIDKDIVKEYLKDQDIDMISDIASYDVFKLIDKINKSDKLSEIFSTKKYVVSELNRLGLHIFRCLLSQRIYEARVLKRKYYKHPDYEEFMTNGFVVKENYMDGNYKNLGNNAEYVSLIKMASGYSHGPHYRSLKKTREPFVKNYRQSELHIDTFHPCVKVWIYLHDVKPKDGPLNYVPCSHKNTEQKLKLLYSISNIESNDPEFDKQKGGSFRVSEQSLKQIGLGSLKSLEYKKNTLIVVDTSGLHKRGDGQPGGVRKSLRGNIKRKNPFAGVI